jgi:MFS family permease
MPAVHPRPEPTFEESVEVLEDGDAPIEVSAARGALQSRDYRVMWFGTIASGIGTWMQNVVLGAFTWEISHSPAFVSIAYFCQLGPTLLLAPLGGLLADAIDRRKLILFAQLEQLLAALLLAAVALPDDPSKVAICVAVFLGGIGQTFNGPAQSALLPQLVERQHLAGAISLNSAQMNGTRVIGPAIGGVLYPVLGAASVFLVNAVTYLFSMVAVLLIEPRPLQPVSDGAGAIERILDGVRLARRNLVLRRCLVTMSLFSLFSLPFVGQMPTIAADNLGMEPKSLAYGLLYATFAIGALLGALSIGTFLSRQDLRRVTQGALGAFSLLLLTFALLSDPAPAYPVVGMFGFAYFAAVTSLSTVLQEEVDDAYRGRIMSLWQLSFAGMVPVGVMAAGPVAEAFSIRVVLIYGAVAAAGLCWYARVSTRAGAPPGAPARPRGSP